MFHGVTSDVTATTGTPRRFPCDPRLTSKPRLLLGIQGNQGCVRDLLCSRDALAGTRRSDRPVFGSEPRGGGVGPPLQMIGRSFGSDAAAVNLAVLASATLAIDAQPAAGEIDRPWCVQYGGSDGDNGTTCAFTSFEQCMMTARGGGGFCVQNRGTWPMAAAKKPGKNRTGEPGQAALIAADQAIIGIRLSGPHGACNTAVTPCNTPLVPYKDNHAPAELGLVRSCCRLADQHHIGLPANFDLDGDATRFARRGEHHALAGR